MYQIADRDNQTLWTMIDEFERDSASGALQVPDVLSEGAQEDYPVLFRDAVLNFGPEWLLAELLKVADEHVEEVGSANGEVVQATSPQTIEAFVRGEFIRLHSRAVCRLAIEEATTRGGTPEVTVYRAEDSVELSPECARYEGQRLNAHELYFGLGKSTLDNLLRLPAAGQCSVLSVRLSAN